MKPSWTTHFDGWPFMSVHFERSFPSKSTTASAGGRAWMSWAPHTPGVTTGGAGLASSWTIQRPVSVSTHCTGGSFLGACARIAAPAKTETRHPQAIGRRRLL